MLARNWRGMDGGVDGLRGARWAIAGLGVTEIADHYDHIIRQLGRPPVIIGHCLGGLVVQILLDRGLGAAGVAINPAPARGARKLPLSTPTTAFPPPPHPPHHPPAAASPPR